MKAENLLIDEYGYIKLSDFGLSKQATESNTFCGTPEYLSPEMLQGTKHDKTTDWWAFGILVYEMLAGIPPFYDENQSKMFKNILEGEIPWPDKKLHGFQISKDAIDLVQKLLIRDRKQRLGAKSGYLEVLEHRFFKGVNTKKILERKYKAPYIPKKQDMPSVEADGQLLESLLSETCEESKKGSLE